MTGKKVLKVILWIMVLSAAVLIFCFSAQDATQSDGTSGRFARLIFGLFASFRKMSPRAQTELVESVMFVVRKCAHFCIYAYLGFWLMHLVRQYIPAQKAKRGTALLTTVGISCLYAVTDELHQFFVPGRSCHPRDVCIDTAGALTGALIALLFALIWQKLRKWRSKAV